MVWYFIGVYIIKRTLHGRLEIGNFSSSVEKYFTSERSERVKSGMDRKAEEDLNGFHAFRRVCLLNISLKLGL